MFTEMKNIDYDVSCKIYDWGIELYKPQEKTNALVQFGAIVYNEKPDDISAFLHQNGIFKFKIMPL